MKVICVVLGGLVDDDLVCDWIVLVDVVIGEVV